jgi:hypothetical protein
MKPKLFITSKPILDSLLNFWEATEEQRTEAYTLYASGKDKQVENLVANIAGLKQPHQNESSLD